MTRLSTSASWVSKEKSLAVTASTRLTVLVSTEDYSPSDVIGREAEGREREEVERKWRERGRGVRGEDGFLMCMV